MEILMSLWLPVLVSAGVVFVASFLAWVILPHHKPDFSTMKDETGFLGSLRTLGIGPGKYLFPYCGDSEKFKDPEFKKQWEAGPHGVLDVWKGAPSMGKNLALTFLFFLISSIFIGYLGSLALNAESTFRQVFRVTGTAGVMAYSLAFIPNAIWFGRTFRSVVMDILDGVAYGLLTGVVFGLLW